MSAPPPYEAAVRMTGQPYQAAPARQRPDVTEEVKLHDSAQERRMYEDLADLFAIFKVTEHLEMAFARDAITDSAYQEACQRLIAQFRTTESALLGTGTIRSTDEFVRQFQVDCPRAYDRLLRTGVPATVLHPSNDDRGDSVTVAETVQHFITAMDSVKLEQRAVDELHPLISDLMASLTRVAGLPQDFEGLAKMRHWLEVLNKMRAADEVDEDQARQLAFDLESSYTAFHRWLQARGGSRK
mmetsp:Transcript_17221/g.58473  ORF Transcript_17221/g.58473 Transcript_17221/m.58473 type:complete len:242 (-) Transcript_17221:47-772(-)